MAVARSLDEMPRSLRCLQFVQPFAEVLEVDFELALFVELCEGAAGAKSRRKFTGVDAIRRFPTPEKVHPAGPGGDAGL